MCSNEMVEPPNHTEYFSSGGATTLIFLVNCVRAGGLAHVLADAFFP